MNYTHQEMLDLINKSRERIVPQTRENSSRESDTILQENPVFLENPREVYKDKKIKRKKDVSREEREDQMSLTSSPLGSASQKGSPEDLVSQEEEVSNITPARTSNRVSGISVQHCKTERGLKLAVTIQTPEDAKQGTYVELTAELKRHSRLRELKLYQPDSGEFQELYLNTIQQLKDMKPAEGKFFALGRLHDRGVRGKWFADMMAVAKLDSNNKVDTVILNIHGEEYEIAMNGLLSPGQEKIYHCTGIYGNLQTQKPAPTLATAKRKVFA